MKDFIYAVKRAHSEYALFLENQCKQALLEEEERKRRRKRLKRLRELIRGPESICTSSWLNIKQAQLKWLR